MSKRRRRAASEELPLFDYPLVPGAETEKPPPAEKTEKAPIAEAPAPEPESAGSDEPDAADEPERTPPADQTSIFGERKEAVVAPISRPQGADVAPAGVAARLYAGVADLAVNALAVTVAAGAAMALGASVGAGDWPALALLALAFSLLYWVVPLAFWGQTPGMAWIGHGARTQDDEPLTFGQAALRWLGALLTVALLGLPLLLALAAGGSLSDRLSQSRTVVVTETAS